MTYYFEHCIVGAENFEERVAIMTRIVEIMIRLMEHNNFNGVFEIVSALNSAPIHRLEHTRAAVERNNKLKKAIEEASVLTHDHYKKFEKILIYKIFNNILLYFRYMEKLSSINPPCVPFLGNFLTNIVHLEVGNPKYLSPPPNAENISMLDSNSTTTTTTNNNNQNTNLSMLLDDGVDSKLINFQKTRRVAETIIMIQQYQNEPYNNLKNFNSQIWVCLRIVQTNFLFNHYFTLKQIEFISTFGYYCDGNRRSSIK